MTRQSAGRKRPWLSDATGTLLGEALPTETNVESGTSQSKSGTSVDLSNSGYLSSNVNLRGSLSGCEARSARERPWICASRPSRASTSPRLSPARPLSSQLAIGKVASRDRQGVIELDRQDPSRVNSPERPVFYCRTTSASTAPRTPRRMCCPYASVNSAVSCQAPLASTR